VGKDTYRKGEAAQPLPYTENLEPEVATHGAWISRGTYEARVYLYHSPARVAYTFNFEGDKLTMKTDLHQALLGRRDLEVITGQRE
jgi:hypothetical protein